MDYLIAIFAHDGDEQPSSFVHVKANDNESALSRFWQDLRDALPDDASVCAFPVH